MDEARTKVIEVITLTDFKPSMALTLNSLTDSSAVLMQTAVCCERMGAVDSGEKASAMGAAMAKRTTEHLILDTDSNFLFGTN